MRAERIYSFGWALVLAGVAAIIAVAVIGLLATAETVPGTGIAVIGGLLVVYLFTVLLGTGTALIAAGEPEAGTYYATDWDAALLELMDDMPVGPILPVTVGVAGVTGGCALGFRPGQTWTIDADGHMSRPMCRPAVTALASFLPSLSADDWEHGVPCKCPLGNREVVFAVHSSLATSCMDG